MNITQAHTISALINAHADECGANDINAVVIEHTATDRRISFKERNGSRHHYKIHTDGQTYKLINDRWERHL